MAPDFRKAFRGLGGGSEHTERPNPASGVAPSLGSGGDRMMSMSNGAAAAAMPVAFPGTRPPDIPSAAPFQPVAIPAPEAVPAPPVVEPAPPAAPAQPFSTTLAKSLGVPEGKPDSVLDLRAQAALILGDVIADLVRESRLEAPEVVDEKRQSREQDFARLLEEQRDSHEASIAHHAFDPAGGWGFGSEDVERSMHGRKTRERRGRGRMY